MSDNKKNREELKNYFRKGNVPTCTVGSGR